MLKGINVKSKYFNNEIDYTTVESYLSTVKKAQSKNCSRDHTGQVRSLLEEFIDDINELLDLGIDSSNYSKTFMNKNVIVQILNNIVAIGMKTDGFFTFFDKYNTEVEQMYFYGNIDKSFFSTMDMSWGFDTFYKIAEYSFYAFYNLSVIQGQKVISKEPSMFEEIARITRGDHKTMIERCLKGTEELGELAQAILSYEGVSGCEYKGLGIDHVKEEAVDLFLVAVSIMTQTGATESEINDIISSKMMKWERKTSGSAKILRIMEEELVKVFPAVMVSIDKPYKVTGHISTCAINGYFSIGFTIFERELSIYMINTENLEGFGHENIRIDNYKEENIGDAINGILCQLYSEMRDMQSEWIKPSELPHASI